MEITVFYVHALRPVMVPVLMVLAAAKFALIAMFFMHLKYDGWLLTGVFCLPADDGDRCCSSALMGCSRICRITWRRSASRYFDDGLSSANIRASR